MSKKEKVSDDLGLKVGTHKEALWSKVLDEATEFIKQSENNLIIQRAIKLMAEKEIAVEKEKLI